MSFKITVHNRPKNEAVAPVVHLGEPLMSFMDSYAIVKEKYKNAFKYLEDK